mgnify:CR=1 FL=1
MKVKIESKKGLKTKLNIFIDKKINIKKITIKNNNEKNTLLLAIPISINALAKPSPCNNPKLNAIIHGDLISPFVRVISKAR